MFLTPDWLNEQIDIEGAVKVGGILADMHDRCGGREPFGSSPSHPGAVAPSVAKVTVAIVITCDGEHVTKPSEFVITYVDANTQLSKTHWSTWMATGASGTTRFEMNLCTPYCAASLISYFASATVHLSAPVVTKHGALFSSLVVRYAMKGQSKTVPLFLVW